MEERRAHLEMLQAVISRLAQNSFLLKGWSVTLLSALFALAAANTQARFVYLAYLPLLVFWALDGYFLHQERLFRLLYDHVRNLQPAAIDFAMDTSPIRDQSRGYLDALVSRTVFGFHGTLLVTVIIIMLVLLGTTPS